MSLPIASAATPSIGDTVLDNGRLLVFVGQHDAIFSKQPVDCFIDFTSESDIRVMLDLQDYGQVNYRLNNLTTAYVNNPTLRFTLREYEDHVFEKLSRNVDLNHLENTFYNWFLSR